MALMMGRPLQIDLPVFQEASVPNSLQRHRELEAQFSCRHTHYVGDDFNDNTITVALISECIDKLKKGKAQGLYELTSEHISMARPIIAVHLSLLFKMILKHSIVPDSFGRFRSAIHRVRHS